MQRCVHIFFNKKGVLVGSIIDVLQSKNLLNQSYPSFLKSNIQYEVIMGSFAYGVSGDASDCDIVAFGIPPKHFIFPHLKGYIIGFGKQPEKFETWQQHGIIDKDTNKEYDICVYNIVKFFQLCMENNPNMLDGLFVPQRCILHCTPAAQILRDNRKVFLHKGAAIKCKAYAYSQLSKAKTKFQISKQIYDFEEYHKINHDISLEEVVDLCKNYEYDIEYQKYLKNLKILFDGGHQRAIQVRKTGMDLKFLYHVVRLLNEAEQILIEGDLDIERNREQLKSIRKGEWTFDDICQYFDRKERELENLYQTSQLQYSPDENIIKNLLLSILEHHYGSLNNIIEKPNNVNNIIKELENILLKYRGY